MDVRIHSMYVCVEVYGIYERCVCMYVCMYQHICMLVCMHVSIYQHVCIYTCVCMYE